MRLRVRSSGSLLVRLFWPSYSCWDEKRKGRAVGETARLGGGMAGTRERAEEAVWATRAPRMRGMHGMAEDEERAGRGRGPCQHGCPSTSRSAGPLIEV